jgi:chromate reductase, NAD(P)H dehydrogenase (quinone)
VKVLGISGSLREGSYNTGLIRAAASMLPPGAELEPFERLREIPPYVEGEEQAPPEAVVALKRAIEAADAVLIATPEYNHSIPGSLKNALDWVSRPLAANPMRNKPALVVGASTGMFGAVWAQAETRKVLGALGARVLDEELPVARAPDAFDDGGALADPELRARLAELLGQLAGRDGLARAA